MRPLHFGPCRGGRAAARSALAALLAVAASGCLAARATAPALQVTRSAPQAAPRPATESARETAAQPPLDYLIGPEDVLSIVFWGDASLSGDVMVRPDGKISLPLLNDVTAVGLTPDQLRTALIEAARRFVEDPNVTVVIREIKSRKVFITGNVDRPGPYPLTGPTTVLQLIAMAGGLREFADASGIRIVRTEGGTSKAFRFNYEDVSKGRNLGQNVLLHPGDTVLVP